jgi:hypothetical protein
MNIIKWNKRKNSGNLFLTFLLLILLVSGCSTVEKRSQLLEASVPKTERSDFLMTPAVASIRVQALAPIYSGVIERTADEIIDQSTDPEVTRDAYLWKMNAIPASYAALFNSDPFVALLDVWAFNRQMDHYFRTGKGKESFGQWSPTALAAVEQLQGEVEKIIENVRASGDLPKAREGVELWAREHPIEDPIFTRYSAVVDFADVAAKVGVSTLGSMGNLVYDLDDLTAQLAVYFQHLPKQARWQAELAVSDILPADRIDYLLEQLTDANTSLTRGVLVAEGMPGLIHSEMGIALEALRRERIEAMKSLDRQRLDTMRWASAERDSIMDEVRDEGFQLTHSLTEDTKALLETRIAQLLIERDLTLKEMEIIANRVVKNSLMESKQQIIDHFIFRIAQLLGAFLILCLIAGGIFLAVIRKRSDSGSI